MPLDEVTLAGLAGNTVVCWGAAREAAATIRAVRRLNIDCTLHVYDEAASATELEGVAVTGDSSVLDEAEIIVLSPGVSHYKPEVVAQRERGALLTTATNLWFAEGYSNVIAVTGTKGKSTTSALTAHLLSAIGTAQIAGNIGQSPIDFVGVANPDWWVLELSSFQTAGLTRSPDIAVLTTLSPEHLDWHGDFEHYRADKLNLFAHNPNIVSLINTEDPGAAAVVDMVPNVSRIKVDTVNAMFTLDDQELFAIGALKLVGRHNLRLACLALSAVDATGYDLLPNREFIAKALNSFEALPHRLSPVATKNGVDYIDDGLATTPIATMAALDAFGGRPTTILLGGHDRGVSYDALGAFIARRSETVRVITMPANGPRIAGAIEAGGGADITVSTSLDDAVHIAAEMTPKGGVVLLSPAAASFGAFKDYVERSDAFVAAVNAL